MYIREGGAEEGEGRLRFFISFIVVGCMDLRC
jgi:hypothetical protein